MPPRTSQPKSAALQGFYLVTGNDAAEVRRKAQEMAIELAPPNPDVFSLETLEAPGENIEHALDLIGRTMEAIVTVPFLNQGKLVWLKDASFLKDSVTGRSATVHEALEKFLSLLQKGLPEGITLLISALEPDKRRSFYKKISSLASVTICDKPDFGFNGTERDIVGWVTQRAGERGIELDPEAAEVLTARIGANSGQLETELNKLVTAANDAKITTAMVRELVPLTRMGGIFDLSNAISKRDLSLSLRTLEKLRHQGETAIALLLAAIIPTVRNLLIAKDLMTRYHLSAPKQPFFFASSLKKIPQEELSHLPKKKDGTVNAYGLGLAAMNAEQFSLEDLREGFLACRDTNAKLLRNQGSEDTLLTQLVIRLVAPLKR